MAAGERFVVERELGRGGMGVVLLVRDRERGGERVALKRLARDADPEALRREFAAARRLRHPVIVAAHELGCDEAGPFLIMEYVDGEDLAALAGKVEPERVASWALLLADALEYARRRGLVHGDIKPQNLLVPRADPTSVRLLDLGLVSLAGERASGGTLAYLAPEVLKGGAPDTRSDLFALGCVLYECLTGHPPFAGVVRREAPPPLPQGVPEKLREVVLRLLKPRPDERPGRPSDLVLLLGDAPGLRLPLPEGDLVERDEVMQAVTPGAIVLVVAAEGMGATRLVREIRERAEAGAVPLLALDVDESASVAAADLAAAAAAGKAVVAAFRPAALPAIPGAHVLTLTPLSPAGVERLVASRLPLEARAERQVAAWVLGESGGVPALVVEALECLRDGGLFRPGPLGLEYDAARALALAPEALGQGRIARAIARLEPGSRRAAARLAVLGAEPGHPELEAARVLEPGPDGALRFASEALRRALEETLEVDDRRRLHAEAAERLLAEAGEPAAIARHLVAAGRDAEAGPWLARAGEAARVAGAHDEARQLLALAVERLGSGPERARAHLALAGERALAGGYEEAVAGYAAARAEDPALARASWGAEAELHASRQAHGAARAAALELIRLSRHPGGEADRARALLVLGRVAAERAVHEGARRHLEGALCLYKQLGDVASVARTANALGNVAFLMKRYDAALVAYREALEPARQSANRRLEGMVLQNLALIYFEHRRSPEEARPAIEAAVAFAEAEGDPARLARALVPLGLLDQDLGRPDDARRNLERARALHEQAGDEVGAGYDRVYLGEVLGSAGRFAEAQETLAAALVIAEQAQDRSLAAAAHDEIGRLRLDAGDASGASASLTAAVEAARSAGQELREAGARASLALARLAGGDAAAGRAALAGLSPALGGDPVAESRHARADAVLLAAEGRASDALDRLESLALRLQDIGLELELARCLLASAVMRGSRGQVETAFAELDRARQIFERRGAKALLARTLLAKAKLRLGA